MLIPHDTNRREFSITVVACSLAAYCAPSSKISHSSPSFFPVDIMRFKNLLTRLVGKATFPPVLHTLFVLLFYLYFSVTEIGLYSSVYLAL